MNAEQMKRRAGRLIELDAGSGEAGWWGRDEMAEIRAILRAVAGGEVNEYCPDVLVIQGGEDG